MLRLNDYLPYLINRLGPPIEDGFAEPLRQAGVTLQMWRVLAVLYEYGDQPVGELARLTSIHVSTLSRLVSRMARKQLVSRRRNGARGGNGAGGGDARSVTVHLLKTGRAKAETLIPQALDYEERLARTLTKDEIATLKRLVVKFHDGLSGAPG